MIVIAIVVTIAGLAFGVFGTVRRSQNNRAAEVTIVKVASALEQQWNAVIDNAKGDAKNSTIPSGVVTLAGGDSRRALVIWTKVSLKREFPVNFDEITWPSSNGFENKAAYVSLIQGWTAPNPRDPHMESAILLMAALKMTRRGMAAFDVEQSVGAHAATNVNYGNKSFRVFQDSWGTPIAFSRWPSAATNAAAVPELNQPPYEVRNRQNQLIDPQDPERTLLENSWRSNFGNAFQQLLHSIRNPPQNLSPIVFSAGADQSFNVNQDLSVMTGAVDEHNDNIYSHRVRGAGNRGD
jgi:hypothetical protein